MKILQTLAVLVALAMLAGCATTSLPDENYKPGETVAAASERNPERNPKAKLYIQQAKDKMAEAEKLEKDGEEMEAKLKLMEAQADADYALAILRREDVKVEAEQIREKIRKLDKEMGGTEEATQ